MTLGFKELQAMPVRDLTDNIVQVEINKEAQRVTRNGRQISAKTVKNEWGTISAALRSVCGLSFNVKLPKYQVKEKQLSPVSEVLKAIKGKDIELACLFALWRSLRVSEVRGLRYSDLHDGALTVNRVLVDAGETIAKDTTKTDSSRRSFPVPDYIMQLIESDPRYAEYIATGKDDYIVNLTRMQIYDRWRTICKHNNFNMTFHDLRGMNASILLNVLKAPEKAVQKQGGWSTDYVMKRHYSSLFDDTMKTMYDTMDGYIAEQMGKNYEHIL